MTIHVPIAFAEAIRRKRLLTLSLLAVLTVGLAICFDMRMAFAAVAAILAISVILGTYNLPLLYRVSRHGVYLTTSIPGLSVPLSLAINFWLAWPFSSLTDVRLTHYDQHPALLIRTRFQRRGSILPINRADAESVAGHLIALAAKRGVNAFS